MIELNIDPMPKPRLTYKGKWTDRAKKYYEWCNELKWLAKEQKLSLGMDIRVDFHLPMPKSWSKKKKAKMNETRHEQKPDLDNIFKGFVDALLEEDSSVWHIHTAKFWGYKGKIIIY